MQQWLASLLGRLSPFFARVIVAVLLLLMLLIMGHSISPIMYCTYINLFPLFNKFSSSQKLLSFKSPRGCAEYVEQLHDSEDICGRPNANPRTKLTKTSKAAKYLMLAAARCQDMSALVGESEFSWRYPRRVPQKTTLSCDSVIIVTSSQP